MIANLVAYYAMKRARRRVRHDRRHAGEERLGDRRRLALARDLQARGRPVGYGTDLLGALQVEQSREFMIRSEVMSPIEIIRSATTIGAEVVRQEGKLGTLEARRLRRPARGRRRSAEESRPVPGAGQALAGHHEGRPVPQEPAELTMHAVAADRPRRSRALAPHRAPIGRWALNGAAALALGFILLPLFFVTWLAFFRQEIPSFPPEGYSLRWFARGPRPTRASSTASSSASRSASPRP